MFTELGPGEPSAGPAGPPHRVAGLSHARARPGTVQRALGHSKATTTLDRYSHHWPTAEDRTRRAAAELLAHSLRTTR